MTLVAHYPLTEDSGSTAYDYSGNEYHGSVTGAGPAGQGTVSGPLGQSAYDFDGSDDFIDVGETNVGFDYLTLSCWLYPDSWDASDYNHIMSASNTNNTYILRHDSSGNYNFWVYVGGSWNSINGTVPPTGQWNHIVATFDGSNQRLYLNGEEDASGAVSGTLDNSDIGGIGGKANGSRVIDGKMADVRVYDHALAPTDVAYLYEVSQRGTLTTEVKS